MSGLNQNIDQVAAVIIFKIGIESSRSAMLAVVAQQLCPTQQVSTLPGNLPEVVILSCCEVGAAHRRATYLIDNGVYQHGPVAPSG